MKMRQKFMRAEDKKHSVVFKPVPIPNQPDICSSVYLSRNALGNPIPERVEITLSTETDENQNS